MLHYVHTKDIHRVGQKELFVLPFMMREFYPGNALGKQPFLRLIEWSNDVDMTMYWNGTNVYFESEEDRLNFQFVWTFPPYGPKE